MNSRMVKVINDAGGEVFLVGGAVRDEILGITEIKDRDYVISGIPFKELESLLQEFGQVNPVGKHFGVIKLRIHGTKEELDIALPRRERSTGEGHRDFEVDFDHEMPIEEDLGRRDFTVNSIAIKLGENPMTIDPFGGEKDIRARVVKQVFPKAFEEDPLRMLRAIQFAARFKFNIDEETFVSMRQNAERLRHVSGERIFEEIKKLMLRAEFPSIGFKFARRGGLLPHFFPELIETFDVSQPNKFHNLDVFNHIMHAVDSVPSTLLHVRIAALFHDIAKPQTKSDIDGEIHFFNHEHKAVPIIRSVLGRWRAPNDVIDKVGRLVRSHMFPLEYDMTERAVRKLIKRVGEDLIFDLIDLRVGDRIASGKPFLSMGKVGRLRKMVDAELAEPAFSVNHLAVGGKDLIELGMKPGPEFRKVLDKLLEHVMEEQVANEKEPLLDLVRSMEDANAIE